MWIDKHSETRTLLKHQKSCHMNQPKSENQRKNEDPEQVRGNPYSGIPELLQEFRENIMDERVPEHRDSHATSSHEPSAELVGSVDLGKHSFYTHFPKDRNCEICQRATITRTSCTRRNCGAVPRAEHFGDLMTADHKIVSEGCESRNNHRYAVVVQHLIIQWIQSYLCKTKTSQEPKGACNSSLSRIGSLTYVNTTQIRNKCDC